MHVLSCVLNGYTHLPLVIMLHGYTERGDKYAGIDPTSDYSDQWVDEGNRPNPDGCFVTVWPQGLETQQGVDPSYVVSLWNAGGCSTLGTSGCDFNEVFALYGGFTAVALGFAWARVPETNGVPLDRDLDALLDALPERPPR